MIQAVAGCARQFPGVALLQQVGKGVAEVAAVEFALLAQCRAVERATAEVEFQ